MFRKMKIGAKLILIGAVILIASLTAVGYLSITQASKGLISQQEESMQDRARELSNAIDDALRIEKKFVTNLSVSTTAIETMTLLQEESSPEEQQTAIDRLSQKLERLKSTEQLGEDYQVVLVTDLEGVVIAASDSSYLGVNIAERDYYQNAVNGITDIGQPERNKVTNEPFVPMSAPIYSPDGTIVGMAATIIDLDFLTQLVLNVSIGENGYAFLTDAQGLAIAHPNESIIFETNVNELPGMETIADRISNNEVGIEKYNFEGDDKTAGFAPITSTGWSVILTISDAEFMAPVVAIRNSILIIAGISLVLAMIMFILFARSISKPIRQGVNFAGEVADGNLQATIEVKHDDEIGELAKALRKMITNLKRIVGDVMSASDQVTSGSQQMSSTAEQLSQGSTEQASSIEEVSSSMEEMSSNISQNADNASETEKIAIQSAQDAE